MNSPLALPAPRRPPARGSPLVSRALSEGNDALASLSAAARNRLWPRFMLVRLAAGQRLDCGDAAASVYFPLRAVISVQRHARDGAGMQVAVIGSEGMIAPALLGQAAHDGFSVTVQVAGEALVVDSAAMMREFTRSGSAMTILLLQTGTLLMQLSQVALCNRHHTVEQQLARWLLTMRDRLHFDDIAVTQERVANMLGVRREAVSESATRLRDAGLLECRRGHFIVRDAEGLRLRSCECYESVRGSKRRAATAGLPAAADAIQTSA